MKRWDDEFEYSGSNDDEGEFWNNFEDEIVDANIVEIDRQLELDVAHKQLNMELLEKSIKLTKSRRIFWFFSSKERRLKAIKSTYRILLRLIDSSL